MGNYDSVLTVFNSRANWSSIFSTLASSAFHFSYWKLIHFIRCAFCAIFFFYFLSINILKWNKFFPRNRDVASNNQYRMPVHILTLQECVHVYNINCLNDCDNESKNDEGSIYDINIEKGGHGVVWTRIYIITICYSA